MASKRSLFGTAAAVAGIAAIIATVRARGDRPPASALEDVAETAGSASVALPTSASMPNAAAVPARDAGAGQRAAAIATLGWGNGAGNIGKPEEDEGHGETPLRLATDGAGRILLLDGVNRRVVRLGSDGKSVTDLEIPIDDPRDLAVTKDGTVLLLDSDPGRANVSVLGPNGKVQTTLPLPKETASSSRALVVSGNDVFVEAYNGELTRVGSTRGVADPKPALVPGWPMRDGTGYLNALIPDPDSGRVHVYVVERATEEQRWSKLLAPALAVEGIFLADTSAAGTIYLGITGDVRGARRDQTSAMLLCLEPLHGEVIGAIDLPVNIGPEAILDAKALESGGVVLSIHTKAGVRVERHDCR